MSKDFVIWGGYGGLNIGDEAILLALSRQLRRLDPSARQSVLLPNGVTDFARAQYAAWNIGVVPGKGLAALRALLGARLVVGGGQMVDDSSIGWPVGWSSIFLFFNRLLGGRSVVVCIGAESLKKPLQRFLVKNIYGLARALTCRDDDSTEILRGVGIPAGRVWTTRDIVFSLDRQALPQRPSDAGTAPVKVAFLIAYDPKRIRESTDRSVLLIDALLATGVHVELVAHDLRPEYDLLALGELQTHYAANPSVTISAVQSVDDVLHLYSTCDAVISGRMHPLILAAMVGTLPIAFGGKAKVRSLLTVSAIPSLATLTAAEQCSEVHQLLANRSSILPRLAENLQLFRQDVETSMAKALSL